MSVNLDPRLVVHVSLVVKAKLYPMERIVGSHKCKGKHCEVCLSVQETCFSSLVTNET